MRSNAGSRPPGERAWNPAQPPPTIGAQYHRALSGDRRLRRVRGVSQRRTPTSRPSPRRWPASPHLRFASACAASTRATSAVCTTWSGRRCGPLSRGGVREFATGRALLRELMEVDEAIPVAADRTPLVPSGFRVSLAHDDRYTIAAVSRDERGRGAGHRHRAVLLARSRDRANHPPARRRARRRPPRVHVEGGCLQGVERFRRTDARASRCPPDRLRSPTFEAEVVPDGVRIRGRFTEAVERWLALCCRADRRTRRVRESTGQLDAAVDRFVSRRARRVRR